MYYNLVKTALISRIKSENELRNGSAKQEQVYKILYSYYDDIRKINSDEDVQSFLSKLRLDVQVSLNNYEKYYAIYQEMSKKNAPVAEKNKIAKIINNYAYEAETIDTIIQQINKIIAEQKFRPANKKAPQKEEVKSLERKQMVEPKAKTNGVVAEGYNREFLKNQYALDYFLYSKMIKEKHQKLATLKQGSEEEKKLRIEMYKDVEDRRKLIADLLGDSDSFKDTYSDLLHVESQERLLYESNIDVTIEEEDLDYNDCYVRISECLTEISNLNFTDKKDSKKLREITDKFDNIIASINDVIKSNRLKELARDLFNLASTYNIDGSYRKFEKYYRNKRIGTERVSKNMYRKGISEINSKLGELFSELMIKLSNKKVHVKSHDKTFKEKERDLYKYHYRICNHFLTLEKGKIL